MVMLNDRRRTTTGPLHEIVVIVGTVRSMNDAVRLEVGVVGYHIVQHDLAVVTSRSRVRHSHRSLSKDIEATIR